MVNNNAEVFVTERVNCFEWACKVDADGVHEALGFHVTEWCWSFVPPRPLTCGALFNKVLDPLVHVRKEEACLCLPEHILFAVVTWSAVQVVQDRTDEFGREEHCCDGVACPRSKLRYVASKDEVGGGILDQICFQTHESVVEGIIRRQRCTIE